MALEVLKSNEINIDVDEYKELYKKRKLNRTNVLIVSLLILLLLLICFRIATIGFNAMEAWEVDNIELTGDNIKIDNNTKINVFSGLDRIAPMSNGTYKFSVKNNSNYDLIYNINFEHDMTNYVNMKYRLKMDNIYIKGNENEYIDIDNLNVESIIVPRQSINIYTLEWKWEDDDENDMKVGAMKENQYYYFRMQILSNIYEK